MNTMQQEFDAVVAHLYKQGRPAVDTKRADGPGCYYRTPGENPLSCAVGCRIPDAVYDKQMDVAQPPTGTGLNTLISRFRNVLPVEITSYVGLFDSLQTVHDGCAVYPDGTFRLDMLSKKLAEVAGRFELAFTVPQGA